MKDEHAFIRQLGIKPWCSVDRRRQYPTTRKRLLSKYLEVCLRRDDWGGLNGTVIIGEIEKAITREAIHGN
jgi:hypothetical protein